MKPLKFLFLEKTQFLTYAGLTLLYASLVFFTQPLPLLALFGLLLIIAPPILLLLFKAGNREHRKNILLLTLLTVIALLFFAGQHDLLWLGQITDAEAREKAEGIRLFLRICFLLFMGLAMLFAVMLELNKHRNETDRDIFIRKKIITAFSLLAFLITLNYSATLRPFMTDLTLMRRFSLSSEGRDLVRNIKTPVKITAFYPFFHDLHREMELFLKDISQTNSLISYSTHDALREREIAEAGKVDRNGWLVIETIDPESVDSDTRERSRRLSFTTAEQMRHLESDVLAALLAAVSRRKTVYFSVNHGETGTGTFSGEEQITRFIDQLKKNNYEIRYLTPQNNFPAQVPADASAVIILGAAKNFSETEKKALIQYRDNGGRFLLALRRDGADLGFLLQPFGLSFNSAPARSEIALKPRSNNVICEQYADHPLTRRLLSLPETERFSFFPDAGSFTLNPNPDSFADFTVISDSRSWPDANRNGQHDRDKEPMGSLNMAVAAGSQTGPNTRRVLAAFSSPDFLQNRYLAYGQNLYLAIGALNWLLEDERIQGLVPYRTDEKPVRLSASRENILFYGFSIIWPLTVFFLGLLLNRNFNGHKSKTSHED